MYQALYRKYRPRTFDAVVGQRHITDVLSYAVQSRNISHAYLFCGSRGTGKTSCAKILSRAINCLSPVNGSPCGKCEACLATEDGTATDIVEMDAASNTGVNDVRDIRDAVVYAPSLLKYRVFIIDEVHMLSISAFNALLKTLEEPPSNVVFILATTELQKLPATIISRCQRFDFRRITSADIADHLTKIAEKEEIQLDADAALALSRLARGGMRDAISLLELNVRPDRHITLQSVREITGMIGREDIARLVGYIANRQSEAIFTFVNDLYTSSKDISVFWQDLIFYYRDMLVAKTATQPERFLDLTQEELAELRRCADLFSYASLLWQAKLLADTGIRMQSGGDRRIEAELTLIKLTSPESDTSPEALAARLRALEDRIAMGDFGTPAVQRSAEPETTATVEPNPKPENTPAAQESKIPLTPQEDWKPVGWFREVIRRFEDKDPARAAFLRNAAVTFSEPSGTLLVELPNEFALTMLQSEATVACLVGLSNEYEKVKQLRFSVNHNAGAEDTASPLDEIINGKD